MSAQAFAQTVVRFLQTYAGLMGRRPMTLDEFRGTLREATPPASLSRSLEALWRIANDEWDAAHRLVQSGLGSEGAWIHAHLHRIEGDLSNATYWYRRAGKSVCSAPLDEEWAAIASALLSSSH